MRNYLLPPILPALFLAVASTPCAAGWVKIAEADQSVIYLDTAITQKVGNNVMVWNDAAPRTIMGRVVEVACVDAGGKR